MQELLSPWASVPMPIPYHPSWDVRDSTKLNTYAACDRKFFYEYLLGWRREGSAFHLEYGKAFHEGMEVLYKGNLTDIAVMEAQVKFGQEYEKNLSLNIEYHKSKTLVNGVNALALYAKHYESDRYNYEVIASEAYGTVPIGDDREMAYKIDLVLRDKQDNLAVLEHKTASNMNYLWEMQWDLAIQTGAYTHVQYHLFPEYNRYGVIVNGVGFSTRKIEFKRKACYRSKAHMLAWLQMVNRLWDRIDMELEMLSQESTESDSMAAFPMNPKACTDYGGCPYHTLCVAMPNPLQHCHQVALGYEQYFWNPLEEAVN